MLLLSHNHNPALNIRSSGHATLSIRRRLLPRRLPANNNNNNASTTNNPPNPSHNGINIRPIQASDISRLAEIEQQCGEWSACWSAADIAAELDNSLSRAAVAAAGAAGAAGRDSDAPLGYIVCWLVAGELQVAVSVKEVLECAVDPAHQSQGIGSALLQHMLQSHSHPQGAVLEVKAHNSRAIALYRRHGFAEVGRRPKFYACGADAVLMARQSQGEQLEQEDRS